MHAAANMHAQMTADAMARQTDTQRLAMLAAVEMNLYTGICSTCNTASMADFGVQHIGLAMSTRGVRDVLCIKFWQENTITIYCWTA